MRAIPTFFQQLIQNSLVQFFPKDFKPYILSMLFFKFIEFHHPVISQIPVLLPAFPCRNGCYR